MRTLITGGAGFIGSHLVDALVARGDHVSVLDNLTSGSLDFLTESRDSIDNDFVAMLLYTALVTPKGALRLAMCNASATRKGL